MTVERINKNKFTITLSSAIDSYGLQRLIDYVKYLEATSKSKAKQSDADKLADKVNADWWTKKKYIYQVKVVLMLIYFAAESLRRIKLKIFPLSDSSLLQSN